MAIKKKTYYKLEDSKDGMVELEPTKTNQAVSSTNSKAIQNNSENKILEVPETVVTPKTVTPVVNDTVMAEKPDIVSNSSSVNTQQESDTEKAYKLLLEKINALQAPNANFSYKNFSSDWENVRDDLMKQAMSMSYEDFLKSNDYQTLANRYANAGELAMQNTLGQVSARTGGLASSYAGTAAQQSYNQYMNDLSDASQSMYNSQLSNVIDQADKANSYLSSDYSRYLQDRENAYSDWSNKYNNQYNAYTTEYNNLLSELNALSGSGNTNYELGTYSDVYETLKSSDDPLETAKLLYIDGKASEDTINWAMEELGYGDDNVIRNMEVLKNKLGKNADEIISRNSVMEEDEFKYWKDKGKYKEFNTYSDYLTYMYNNVIWR